MKMNEMIASTQVRRLQANGKESIVSLQISKPFRVSAQEWCCYATDPGTKRMKTISGNDGIQVLSIALNFFGRRMRELEEEGIAWRDPEIDDEFPIDPYFFLDTFHRSLESKSESGSGGD
ncbi:MAG: hypothetical protein JJU00_08915 [Opitutales bacterium]|nr:hypothetical protein [Opitutales bacterium]